MMRQGRKCDRVERRFPSDSGESIARKQRNIGCSICKRALMFRECGFALAFSKTLSRSMSGRRWRLSKNRRKKRRDRE